MKGRGVVGRNERDQFLLRRKKWISLGPNASSTFVTSGLLSSKVSEKFLKINAITAFISTTARGWPAHRLLPPPKGRKEKVWTAILSSQRVGSNCSGLSHRSPEWWSTYESRNIIEPLGMWNPPNSLSWATPLEKPVNAGMSRCDSLMQFPTYLSSLSISAVTTSESPSTRSTSSWAVVWISGFWAVNHLISRGTLWVLKIFKKRSRTRLIFVRPFPFTIANAALATRIKHTKETFPIQSKYSRADKTAESRKIKSG